MEKCKAFLSNHIDFKFYQVSWISLIVFLAIFPCLAFMPQKYGYENGLLEDIQMLVLWVMVYLCATAKVNIRFFRYMIWVLMILIIREVNCFRTLLFPRPEIENGFYSWRDINYDYVLQLTSFTGQTRIIEGVLKLGPIAHGLYGAYIAFVALFFFVKKIHVEFIEIIKKIKFPFWNILFASIAMFMGAIAEKATNNNFIFEEGFELLFYVSLAGLVYLYSRNKTFSVDE